eukprot:COSAG01_NODE_20986_length_923_cov_9.266990_1_plen_172_part_10
MRHSERACDRELRDVGVPVRDRVSPKPRRPFSSPAAVQRSLNCRQQEKGPRHTVGKRVVTPRGTPLAQEQPLIALLPRDRVSPDLQDRQLGSWRPAVDGNVATVSYCILPGPAAQGDMLCCRLCKLSRSPSSAAAGQFPRAYCRHVGRWGHLLHFADCANDCDGACRRAPQG